MSLFYKKFEEKGVAHGVGGPPNYQGIDDYDDNEEEEEAWGESSHTRN